MNVNTQWSGQVITIDKSSTMGYTSTALMCWQILITSIEINKCQSVTRIKTSSTYVTLQCPFSGGEVVWKVNCTVVWRFPRLPVSCAMYVVSLLSLFSFKTRLILSHPKAESVALVLPDSLSSWPLLSSNFQVVCVNSSSPLQFVHFPANVRRSNGFIFSWQSRQLQSKIYSVFRSVLHINWKIAAIWHSIQRDWRVREFPL